MNKLTPHSLSFLGRTFALIVLVAASFATVTQAQPILDSTLVNSLAWEDLKIAPLPGSPLSIDFSPATHNFVALAKDDTKENSYGLYFLNPSNLIKGWEKKYSWEDKDLTAYSVLYAASQSRFVVTGRVPSDSFTAPYNTEGTKPIIASFLDNGLSWQTSTKCDYFDDIDQMNSEERASSSFVDIGSDDTFDAHPDTFYLFPLTEDSGKVSHIGVGFCSFNTQMPLEANHGITAMAGDNNGYIGIGSDGSTYFGTNAPALPTTTVLQNN
ncbi:MAG: hypothetical protein K2W99_05445 [Chthoniobacterales bacterium]|nr:hypothetical protein [Chthoniobacterales bacterium]